MNLIHLCLTLLLAFVCAVSVADSQRLRRERDLASLAAEHCAEHCAEEARVAWSQVRELRSTLVASGVALPDPFAASSSR